MKAKRVERAVIRVVIMIGIISQGISEQRLKGDEKLILSGRKVNHVERTTHF